MGCDVVFKTQVQICGKYYEYESEVTNDISSLEEDVTNIKEELRLMIGVDINKQIPTDFDGSTIEYIIGRTEYLFTELESKISLLVRLYLLLDHVKSEGGVLKDISGC